MKTKITLIDGLNARCISTHYTGRDLRGEIEAANCADACRRN